MKLFGKSQQKMRETDFKKTNEYLGIYHHNNMLKVGEIQSLLFQAMDKGPFWITEEEREHQRHDQVIPGQARI